MGPQLDAGQFLRPLEAPRPADRNDFAGAASTNRSEPGDDRFQTILEDARTTKAPRKAEASPHGASGHNPASVDREKHDDAPDATSSQTPTNELAVAPAPTESEDASPDTDGASVDSGEAARSGDTQCNALPPQPPMKPSNPGFLPLIQGTIVDVISPPSEGVAESVEGPELGETECPTLPTRPFKIQPADTSTPIAVTPPIVHISDVKPDVEGNLTVPAPPSRPEDPTLSAKRPIESKGPSMDAPDDNELKAASIKADPKWITEKRPIGRPLETPPSEAPVKKEKPAVRFEKGPARPEKGEIKGTDPLNPEPRHKKVERAASEGPLVEVHASARHRPISVRSGSGDSAAATVGRFLIETNGEGEPTTANLPSQANERAVSVTSTNPTPTRASVERPQKIDVTVTTLSQLLVGGTDGADGLEAAAKALSGTQRPGNHHVTLQLDPPELGQLRLDIRMQHQEMTLRVAADTAEVARLIESRLTELRDVLATHGIRIDRSEVVVRSHGTENANSQSGQQGGSSSDTDGTGNGADTSGSAWSGEGALGEAPDQGTWDGPPPGTFISYPEPDVGTESPWEEGAEGATQEMLVDLVA